MSRRWWSMPRRKLPTSWSAKLFTTASGNCSKRNKTGKSKMVGKSSPIVALHFPWKMTHESRRNLPGLHSRCGSAFHSDRIPRRVESWEKGTRGPHYIREVRGALYFCQLRRAEGRGVWHDQGLRGSMRDGSTHPEGCDRRGCRPYRHAQRRSSPGYH